jgi:hypothetical protein
MSLQRNCHGTVVFWEADFVPVMIGRLAGREFVVFMRAVPVTLAALHLNHVSPRNFNNPWLFAFVFLRHRGLMLPSLPDRPGRNQPRILHLLAV